MIVSLRVGCSLYQWKPSMSVLRDCSLSANEDIILMSASNWSQLLSVCLWFMFCFSLLIALTVTSDNGLNCPILHNLILIFEV